MSTGSRSFRSGISFAKAARSAARAQRTVASTENATLARGRLPARSLAVACCLTGDLILLLTFFIRLIPGTLFSAYTLLVRNNTIPAMTNPTPASLVMELRSSRKSTPSENAVIASKPRTTM